MQSKCAQKIFTMRRFDSLPKIADLGQQEPRRQSRDMSRRLGALESLHCDQGDNHCQRGVPAIKVRSTVSMQRVSARHGVPATSSTSLPPDFSKCWVPLVSGAARERHVGSVCPVRSDVPCRAQQLAAYAEIIRQQGADCCRYGMLICSGRGSSGGARTRRNKRNSARLES